LPGNAADDRDRALQVELGEVLLAKHGSQLNLQLTAQLSHSIG
jgi:hypothetical protein